MRRTGVIVIGGGQAGLAMSRCLGDEGLEHVVLERGRIGERWRSERWDSLRLLTPAWQSRLPGWRYQGSDPDGYLRMPEVVDLLEGYARSFAAPVETGVEVRRVAREGGGYAVTTSRGTWWADNVVVATGQCDTPFVPAMAAALAPDIHQLVPPRYRNPDALPAGGVLVVGASASGAQIAAELARAGRQVTLAAGSHTRVPRRYRGRDIMVWLEACGVLGERADTLRNLEAARRQPSFQLTGSLDRREVDLPTLQDLGVRLAGHARAIDGARVAFAGDLAASAAAAEARLERLLARIDAFIAEHGIAAEPAARPRPFASPAPLATLDLRAEGVGTIIWATGYVRRYPWLAVPVLDASGEIRHQGGITPAAGLYVLGLRLLRTRKSNFLDGVGDDARALAAHIAARAGRRACRAA